MSDLGGGAGRSGCGSGVRTRNACTSISSMEKGGGSCGSSSSSNTSGFPRVSLRSLLLNTPWSLRTRSKRVRTSATSYKVSVEQENSTDSSGVFNENGTSDNSNITSVRRNLARRKSSSPESKGVSRGGSSSSEGGACANINASSSHLANAANSDVRRECPLCLQEVSVDLFPALISCPHSSCLPCFKQYLTVEINESRVNVSCPQCNELLNPSDIHQIVDNALLSFKFEDFMLRRVLSMDPDTRWCPAPDCGYAVIASGCAGCPKLKCERPGCESYFCYHCKAEWHPNQTCDMARAQRSPNIILSSFNYLHDIQNNDDVKSCPRCQVLIMKMDDGSCNHMTCSVCGAEFCWLCMKEISDLHYLSPSGCTFWGKKPWSRKKKILWQLGTLVGAPLGIGLVAGLAVPAMIIGIPIWVGRKLHARYATSNRHRRNIAIVGGVTASALISPVLAGLAVSIGVPILLAYVYGVVPISLCRSGGCGVTTSASGVRIAFDDENDMVFGIPGRQSESSHVGGGTASIGEISCGASLSADSAAHILTGESDRESASNTAIAPASLTASIASSCLSRSHRLEVHADITNSGGRSTASGETVSLAISEHSDHMADTENASVRALAGSLLQYKVTECDSRTGSRSGAADSASGVLEGAAGISSHITSLYIHSRAPSASETSSAVLTNECGENSSGTDLRLDSVSAIINARQLSRKGVTFLGQDTDAVSDHVSLTLDDDDEESLSQYKEDALSSYSNDKEDTINSSSYVDANSQNQESRALNETRINTYQKDIFSQSDHEADLVFNRALSSVHLINPKSSTVPSVHKNNRTASITKSFYIKRRSSSAEASDRSPKKPVRSESFPKLQSQ